MENLRLAFWKAKKGKSLTKEVKDFLTPNLEVNLLSMRNQILRGEIKIGGYHYFKIFEPKERLVSAAPFAQRILHHAIMNICHNDFENFQIYDSYASRKGKGIYKALERAMTFQKKYKFCLKLDVRKYFDSIDHLILERMLYRIYKDVRILELFEKIIESYETSPNKGMR